MLIGARQRIGKRHWIWVAAVATALAVVATGAPASAHHRTGSEPTLPYAQPTTPPKRGCATVADALNPAGSIAAVQIIYAWHDGDGNHYEESAEQIAQIVDRIDWLIDESSNYEQHINLSCRYSPNSTYGDYARALVVPEKIEAGVIGGSTPTGVVRDDLFAAGYNDSNRWYLVFTDFSGGSDSNICLTGGGYCYAIGEAWDSGLMGHEFLHVMGAPHAWMGETGVPYTPDIMSGWWDYWNADFGFRNYYDPSELGAAFYGDPYPATVKINIANNPALTVPVCCDVSANNDLLTAQERTIEANNPSSTTVTGFGRSGSGSMRVTPECGAAAVSCKYFDGRRSLEVSASPTATATTVSVTRRPTVTAGQTYKLFTRLRADTASQVRLRLSWYNASNNLLSTSESGSITLTTNWLEWRHTAVAPVGTARVQVSVVAFTPQPAFTYHLDSLQLNHCSPSCRIDT